MSSARHFSKPVAMNYTRILSAAVLVVGVAHSRASAVTHVFWSDSDTSTLWRANGDGSGAAVLLPLQAGAEPRGVAIDAAHGFLFWTENGTNRIRRAGLEGAGPQDIVTSGLGFPADLEIDSTAEKLYWADRDLDVIRRANLDGSNPETVVSVPAPGNNGAPYFLELDPGRGKLYWSDFDSGVIHRANLDGSSPETFVSGLDRVRDIEILDELIYWTDRDTRLVQRQRLDGTLRETLYGPSGLVLPHGLALDASSGLLYIADADGGQVVRGRQDGTTSLQTIGATGLLNPWDVAVVVEAQAGDFNGDGSVDAADYVVWRKQDGSPEGYDTWRENFGATAAGAELPVRLTSVPEPSQVPAWCGLLLLTLRRRM
jgi:low density lipoprotein receptor-related protein 5/6